MKNTRKECLKLANKIETTTNIEESARTKVKIVSFLKTLYYSAQISDLL